MYKSIFMPIVISSVLLFADSGFSYPDLDKTEKATNSIASVFFVSTDPYALMTRNFDISIGINTSENTRIDLGGQIVSVDLERNKGHIDMHSKSLTAYYYFENMKFDSPFIHTQFKDSTIDLELSREYRIRAQNRIFKHQASQQIKQIQLMAGYQWSWRNGFHLSLSAGPLARKVTGNPLEHITSSGVHRAEGYKVGQSILPIVEMKIGVII